MDKVELTPELLRELQLKQLDMLVYFRDFCEKNNLEPLVAKRADWYNRIQVATPVIDGVLDPSVYEVINQVLAEIGLGKKTVDQAAKEVNAAWHKFAGK